MGTKHGTAQTPRLPGAAAAPKTTRILLRPFILFSSTPPAGASSVPVLVPVCPPPGSGAWVSLGAPWVPGPGAPSGLGAQDGAQTAPRDRGQGTRDRGQEGFAFRLRPMKVFKKRGCGMGTSQAQGFESSALKERPRPLFPRRKIGGDKAPFAIILFLLSRRKTVNLTNLAHLAAWEIVLRGK